VQALSEYRGKWWIDSRDRSWPGVFTFTREAGGLLELHADYGDFPEPPSPHETPLIFGETIDGKPITLTRCVQTRASSHIPGGLEVEFDVRYALVGAWFDTIEEIAFDRIDFRLTGLDEWAGISGFDIEYKPTATTVRFAAPEPVELGVGDGVAVRLDFSGGGFQMTNPLLSVELNQTTRASIRCEAPLPLETLAEHVHEVRNFVCFAQRRRADLYDIKTVVEVDVIRGDRPARKQRTIIDILYRTDATTEHSPPPSRERMLFRLEDCTTDPGRQSLTRWLSGHELLGPVYDLYLLGLYAPRTHVEFVYLSLTEGLEALYSRKFPHHELPKQAHAERITAILESAPEQWREWLAEKLAHSNKATFRGGLEELVKTLPPTLLGKIGDIDAFTQRVSWTRNYLTHWTPELEKKAAKDEALVRLLFALRLVLEALLLLEIGFTRDEIERLHNDNFAISRDLDYAFDAT
jgi:ApeA N-terminal domain 1